MQMNYMALSSLHKVYAAQEGPYQDKAREIYDELRNNVIKNVHGVSSNFTHILLDLTSNHRSTNVPDTSGSSMMPTMVKDGGATLLLVGHL